MDLITLIGWIGTVFILGAYLLAATGKLAASAPASLLLNALGCTLVCIQMFELSVWNALFLNAVWGSIAIGSLLWQRLQK